MVRPLTVSNPKLTMEINAGVNGWTESHFYTSAVALDDAALQSAALALVTARCAALDGVIAKLFAARVSVDDINRDSSQIDISGIIPNPVSGYANGPTPTLVQGWTFQSPHLSWPVVLGTTNPTTNPIEYLAGMPASTTQVGPFPTQASPNTPAYYLSRYLNALILSAWGALGRNWVSAPYNLTGITFVPAAGAVPPNFRCQFAAAYPGSNVFPPGAYVRLQNAQYTSPQKRLRLNGTYTVASYDPTAGLLVVNVPRVLVQPNFTAYGDLQSADGAVYQYTDYTFRPITHRKRGKAFGGGRGRR